MLDPQDTIQLALQAQRFENNNDVEDTCIRCGYWFSISDLIDDHCTECIQEEDKEFRKGLL